MTNLIILEPDGRTWTTTEELARGMTFNGHQLAVPETMVRAVPRMAWVLEEAQWGSLGGFCPLCKQHKKDGHADWCGLGDMMKEIKEAYGE